MRVAWIGQSNRAKSTNAADISLINGYATVYEHKQGKSALCVYRCPGLKLWQTLTGSGPVRAIFYAASVDRTLAVQGSTLWELHGQSAFSNRGTLLSTHGPVSLDENGVALALVDGEARYSLTFATNAFQFDVNVDYPVASRVAYLDSYFIYLKPN